ESLARLAQLNFEAANTKADQRRLDAVHDPSPLADKRLTLTGRTTGIFLSSGRNRRHAAVLWLTAQPAEQRPHQEAGIQSVCLRPSVFACPRDAGRVDHIAFDPPHPQPARQPKAVPTGLEGQHHSSDLAAGFGRLVPPTP